jgi:hypothetical protein
MLVGFASLTLRVVWCTWAQATPVSDFNEYHSLAVDWCETGQFGQPWRMAYRTPGYPAFLSAVYTLSSPSPKAAAIAQAILGGLTSGMMVLLAGRHLLC